jgi:hypothetical protein
MGEWHGRVSVIGGGRLGSGDDSMVAGVGTAASRAAVIYNTTGSTYNQTFDTLPNTPTNTSLGNLALRLD